jgi:large subunit ribosomal protein L3
LKEYKILESSNYEVGQQFGVEMFEVGQAVAVTGFTIGQDDGNDESTVCRGLMTHGSKSHRLQGSMEPVHPRTCFPREKNVWTS